MVAPFIAALNLINAAPAQAAGGGGGGGSTFLFDMEFRNDGGSTASGQILTRTVAFPAGDVADGEVLEVRKSDGTTPLTYQQVDLIAEYGNGATRFAVITVEQEDNCNAAATQTLKLYKGASSTASNTSSITDQNLKDLDYTVEVDITSVGTVEMDVAAAITAGRTRNTKIGPVLREVRTFQKVQDGLFVIAWIGLRRDGTTAYAYARVNSHWNELYSSSASAPGTGEITALRIKKAGSNAVAYTSLSYDMRGGTAQDIATSTFDAVHSSNAPTMIPLYDLDQLIAANAIIPLKVRAGVVSAIGTPTPSTLVPFDSYDLETNLDATAGRPDIGWMAAWGARALLSQNKGTYQQLRAEFNGTNMIVKNHYNSTSGEPIIVRDETYGSITGDKDVGAGTGSNLIASGEFGQNGDTPFVDAFNWTSNNLSHWPQLPYVTYLIHGMSWHLESVVVDGTHPINASNQPHSQTWANSDVQQSIMRYDGGPRGWGWGLTCLGNAHFCVPAAHPLKDYIADLMVDAAAFANSQMKTSNVRTEALTLGLPIGVSGQPSFVEQVIGGWSSRWFQWHYWMIPVGMEVLRGNISSSGEFATNVVVKAYLGLCNACISRAQSYTVNFTELNGSGTASADIAETWNDVAISDSTGTWNDTTKLIPSTGCPASGTIANWLGMHNYNWYNTAALIVLERAGFTGADVPLDHMINERDTATLASDADKALNPQFDLERMA